MPSYEFCRKRAKHIVDSEGFPLFGHNGMKGDMKKQVSKLVLELSQITAINGFEYFVGFFKKAVPYGLVGLCPVPGTFLPETTNDTHEFCELVVRFGSFH
jgi:hypothetical protein